MPLKQLSNNLKIFEINEKTLNDKFMSWRKGKKT
jgi:hypothetical protein